MTNSQTLTAPAAVPTFGWGDRIRRIRRDRDMDQAAFAQRIGLSKGAIGQHEMRDDLPQSAELIAHAIAGVFGVDYHWTMTGCEFAKSGIHTCNASGAFVTGEYQTSYARPKRPHLPTNVAICPQVTTSIARWTLPRTTEEKPCVSPTPLTTMRPTSTRRAGHHRPSRCASSTSGNSRMHSPTSP